MPHMKTFPRPTESNDHENKSGHRGGLLLMRSYGNRLDQRIALYFRSAKRCQHGEIESGLEMLLCDRGRAFDLNKLRRRPSNRYAPADWDCT
jgi:hypothetical protein